MMSQSSNLIQIFGAEIRI